MKKVTILDTSIATKNLGDQIIVDSVFRELNNMYDNNTMFFRVPTHERISRHSHRIINDSIYSFVAGTNILSSKHNIIKSNLWNISMYDSIKIKRAVLMGVGWGDYQDKPTFLTKYKFENVLDQNIIHSVRDSYTKEKLASIGIDNVINTGCPTMWELSKDHCELIPEKKGNDVIFTLTDYKKDIKKDKKLIEILNNNYDNVYFWVQGSEDYEYITSISHSVKIVGPSLKQYDELLDSKINIDYVGTRLHAGIRAMQKKRRSIIIGIDNRALEKQKDFNINVIDRKDIDLLPEFINSNIQTKLTIDFDSINRWKQQFLQI